MMFKINTRRNRDSGKNKLKYGAKVGHIARQHGKDNDYNCQYTIKEYHSVKDPHTGRNVKVELRPLNPDPQYKVIDVEEEDGEVRIIATLKCVLK